MKMQLTESQIKEMIRESVRRKLLAEGFEGELEKEAKEMFVREELTKYIDWEESDWVASGDETYGPCFGYVESDEGWKFNVPGQQDGHDFEIDMDEPIEYETPEGDTGEFFLN